jgi:hypothetical protein
MIMDQLTAGQEHVNAGAPGIQARGGKDAQSFVHAYRDLHGSGYSAPVGVVG